MDLSVMPPPCREGTHCADCQSERGAGFRKSLRSVYQQTLELDGTCKFGVPRGFTGIMVWPAGQDQHRSVQAPRSLLPAAGDALKIVLTRLGYVAQPNGTLRCPNGKTLTNCGCNEMRAKMNRYGYLGCLLHRRELVEWFVQKASECDVVIERKSVLGLFRQALREWRQAQPKEQS